MSNETKEHFNYINAIYAQRHAAAAEQEASPGDTPLSYQWGGELEERRLRLGNTVDGGFGESHRMYHEKMRDAGFEPKIIVEIGTGSDALLIKHLLNAYPNSEKMYVVELDPKKVAGAKETLEREGDDETRRNKVIFITGDASKELPKLPKADLIDMQLFLTHLPTHPPIDWDAAKQGEYPTLQRVLGIVTDALADRGVAIVGDLATDDFDVNEGPGFDGNEKTRELIKDAKRFIKGDDSFRGLLNMGFNDRGAIAFRDLPHIIEKVKEHSAGRLHIDDGKDATQVNPIQNIKNYDDPRAALAAYIAPTVAFQSEMALNRLKKKLEASPDSPQAEQLKQIVSKMEPGVSELWRLGERFVESLQWNESDPNRKKDDTVASLPSMVHVRFKKSL